MTKKIVKTAFAFQALSPHAQIGAFWPFWWPSYFQGGNFKSDNDFQKLQNF